MTARHPTATTRCRHDRRTFLKGVGLATAASATAASGLRTADARAADTGPFFVEPPAHIGPLPEVDFLGRKMPRMIIGCNQMGGWSHAVPSLSRTMKEYFTPEVSYQFRYAFSKIKKTDVVIVGMWPRFKDEVAQNVGLLKKYGAV